MKVARIVQLGDLHYPDTKGQTLADWKDPGLAKPLGVAVAPNPLKNVMRALLRILQEVPAAIAICGDITSRGDTNGYNEGVEYLVSRLRLDDPARWDHECVHVVPGNHDIDRRVAARAAEADLFTKFDDIRATWNSVGLPLIATDAPRVTDCTHAGATIRLISLNSCVGCGEKRFLPDDIRVELSDLATDRIDDDVDADERDIRWEQLDTPAFHADHLSAAVDEIRDADSTHVPVLVAHHNLLPQALNRYALYTELINGGQARSRLSGCSRPVLYLHGHIHDDPIEVVEQFHPASGRLVAVAAPELRDGFNVIEIFVSGTSVPLGCVVRQFRVMQHGGVDELPSRRVPFVTSGDAVAPHDLAYAIVATLQSPMRMDALREALRETTEKLPQRRTLREAVLEAEWLGLVSVANREHGIEHWHVARTHP